MITQEFDWVVGCTSDPHTAPAEMVPATVPGSVQLDYANAKQYPPYTYGVNYREYGWMEDLFWVYKTVLHFQLSPQQTASLTFRGIDYRYTITIDDTVIADGEGMFTPVVCDISKYAGEVHELTVIIHPAPKADDSATRSQARFSCKPAACYGWDWHPRLISSGLFDRVYISIKDQHHIERLDASYVLNETLDRCCLSVQTQLHADSLVRIDLLDGNRVVASEKRSCAAGESSFVLTVDYPKLWFPTGYGPQPIYTLRAVTLDAGGCILDEKIRKIGFRRTRLLMNEGSWANPSRFPKSRSDAPITLEVNGKRIFAKGSNWVNAHIFPGVLTGADYSELLSLVQGANMNILRIWGGGFVNHESFFDLCDEKGIMVWQEFPLACNEYPDDNHYLSVLEQEATSIVRRLRTHPSLILWCGGNELFNSWSKMTEQHHALRLLDKVCYNEDRYTPFIMTSPLNGMGHGHYLNYDEQTQEEFITTLVHSRNTAYTEFGSPGAASPEYIRQYISEADYADCEPSNEVWTSHHAFLAWEPESWLRKTEAEYFFGEYRDIDDLCLKTQFIQSMCYRSYFEEMRKQWPSCSMALNWCFNEPWPTFANNSLISWPNIPKPSYYAVQAALRPQLASLRIDRHLWWAGETFHAEVWILNDSLRDLSSANVEISYSIDEDAPVFWGTLHAPFIGAQSNLLCGAVNFHLPEKGTYKIRVWLKVSGHPEMDSEYTYMCRTRALTSTEGMLNV